MLASKRLIKAITLTTHDVDYPVTLPAGTTRFRVQCRTAVLLRMYETKGGDYYTIHPTPAPPYKESNVTGARTFYLQGPNDGLVAEVIYWT